MSTDDEKLRVRLRKLLELARRGVGGERDNAQRFLAKLLKKNGLTLDDLQSEERTETCRFTFKNALERKLLIQILGATLDPGVVSDPAELLAIAQMMAGMQRVSIRPALPAK